MVRCFRIFLLLALLIGVAGCASNVVRQTPDVKTRGVVSAEVVWVEPGSVPMSITRSSYGTYARPTIGDADVQYSQKEVAALLIETRRQMVSQVEAALSSSGIKRGDDAEIRVRTVSTYHTITGPGAIMMVSVYFKEDPLKPWSVQIGGGTPIGSNNAAVASKFARTALEELAAAGIIKSTP